MIHLKSSTIFNQSKKRISVLICDKKDVRSKNNDRINKKNEELSFETSSAFYNKKQNLF